MTDQVFVRGLALHAYHGVMPHEAKVGQTFALDLTLDLDLAEASRTDKLIHTVGYDQVVDVASEAFRSRRYRLVEAAAGAVANGCDKVSGVLSMGASGVWVSTYNVRTINVAPVEMPVTQLPEQEAP